MKKFLSAVIAATMLLSFTACSQKTGKTALIMGTNAEFEPFEYRENDKIVGFDVEVANEIAADLKTDLTIEDMAFDSLITALTSGKVDMVVAGMSVTDERKEKVNFSKPYYSASQVIIVKADGSKVAAAADLGGKKVGVQEGTTGDLYVTDEVKGTEVLRFKKAVDAATELKNGKIDAVVLDEKPAQKIVEQNPDLKILKEALTKEEYAIAVAKENTKLLESINKTLDRLASEGKFDQFKAKYNMEPTE